MGRVFTGPIGASSTRINGAATTTIRASGRTVIQRLIIGTTAAGTIAIQDGAGVTLVLFKASMPEGVYELGILANGLKVVTGAASDVVLVYE